jgi:hypothetical protein
MNITGAGRGFLLLADSSPEDAMRYPLVAGLRLRVARGGEARAGADGYGISAAVVSRALASGQVVTSPVAGRQPEGAAPLPLDTRPLQSVVCLPQRSDRLSAPYLEAWSAGKPVVITPSHAASALIWHEVTGCVAEGSAGHGRACSGCSRLRPMPVGRQERPAGDADVRRGDLSKLLSCYQRVMSDAACCMICCGGGEMKCWFCESEAKGPVPPAGALCHLHAHITMSLP